MELFFQPPPKGKPSKQDRNRSRAAAAAFERGHLEPNQ